MLNADDVIEFALAGNATFTVVSRATGARFTYKVSRRDDGPWWRVGLLTGPDNNTDYRYIGSVGWDRERYPAPRFFPPRGTTLADAPASVKGFDVVLRMAATNTDALSRLAEVHHCGRCGRCGRTLTVPASIESGFGPECASKLND